MKYMVCVDGSNNARAAFFTTISMVNKKIDKLFITTVAEHIPSSLLLRFNAKEMKDMVQDEVKNAARALLAGYGEVCKEKEIDWTGLLIISNHPGEAICHQVDKRGIDFLVVGRRGLSAVKRLFTGSTSKFLVEHANCTVMVTKGEWGPSEEHVDIKTINEQEEAERKRRMEEHAKNVKSKSNSELGLEVHEHVF